VTAAAPPLVNAALLQRICVVAEARTWLRTPYHHHARIKGVGVDCAQILCAVYEAAGVVPHVEPGNYPHDWHLHRGEEQYIGWLERCGAHEVQAPAPGDVALFKFGRCWSHGGIYTGGVQVVHAYINLGVVQTRLTEAPLSGREPRYWSLWA
jgi:cell wall-associated NlpC family hydrolase